MKNFPPVPAGMAPWIGVDLDGTLAIDDGWRGFGHVGEPIPAMVERVKEWLSEGIEVRIFTARYAAHYTGDEHGDAVDVISPIQAWCELHIGQVLEITNAKDGGMVELWDDRAIQVITNTGNPILQ